MSQMYDGIAYLDLSGNRIHWTSREHHSKILLQGAGFHDVVPMIALVISCLCGLSLLFVIPSIQRYDSQASKGSSNTKKKTLMSAVLCMIVYAFKTFDLNLFQLTL